MKGVIFDLDGVLVSTDELHYQAWQRLAERIGVYDFNRQDNEKQRGVSRMESLEILLKKSTRSYSSEEKLELAEEKNRYYVELLKDLKEDDALPGAVETLRLLHENGILTAVGSASKNAPFILERTGLLGRIDKVACGLDVTRSKPDPQVFLVAADKLGLDPSECLVVEDAPAGIEAAKRGGMVTLGVGPMHEVLNADYDAEDLSKVADWGNMLWKRK